MLPSDKPSLRRAMKERRAAAFAKNPNAANDLRDRFLSEINLPAKAVVAGYAAQDSEMDPAPLMKALHTAGFRLALPCIGEQDQALAFRAYKPGDALVSGRFAIPEPAAAAPAVELDILLVPLLAFDKTGHRLGRGGGHYDRTLADLRRRKPQMMAIGLAFADQQLSAIPFDSLDAALDKIVTELEVIPILKPC